LAHVGDTVPFFCKAGGVEKVNMIPEDLDIGVVDGSGDTAMQDLRDETQTGIETGLRQYQRIDPLAIDLQVQKIRSIRAQMNDQWDEESAKYEENITVTIRGVEETLPRRNYFNPEGTVQDASLFPYHDIFYPLIDAYDCLYTSISDEKQPSEINSIFPPYSIPTTDRRVSGFDLYLHDPEFLPMLASPQSVCACVFSRSEQSISISSDWRERWDGGGGEDFWNAVDTMFSAGMSGEHIPFHAREFPLEGPMRSKVLLKLFRHAMSELQRDYFLAHQVLLRLAYHGDLDDPDTLCSLLVIFEAESVVCGYPCPNEMGDEHVCQELSLLYASLVSAISKSISTGEHAVALAGFVRNSYSDEFGHLFSSKSSNLETRLRTFIKRAVASRRSEHEEDEMPHGSDRVSVKLVSTIVLALGVRAKYERDRLLASPVVTNPGTAMYSSLDTYWNCMRTLVEIGENTILVLPDAERFYDIANKIVRALAYGVVDGIRGDYPSYLGSETLLSLIDPRRYCDSIVNATVNAHAKRLQMANISSKYGANVCSLKQDVVEDVRDVVRALFISDMVDIRESGLGYGDFLVWTGFEINPLDPALFW
jgi:hypothetical protein